MTNYKFKVGDKVRFMGYKNTYNFRGSIGIVNKGDTVIISAVGISKYSNGIIYSVKGGEYVNEPNWCDTEECFEKVNLTFKERMNKTD